MADGQTALRFRPALAGMSLPLPKGGLQGGWRLPFKSLGGSEVAR